MRTDCRSCARRTAVNSIQCRECYQLASGAHSNYVPARNPLPAGYFVLGVFAIGILMAVWP